VQSHSGGLTADRSNTTSNSLEQVTSQVADPIKDDVASPHPAFLGIVGCCIL